MGLTGGSRLSANGGGRAANGGARAGERLICEARLSAAERGTRAGQRAGELWAGRGEEGDAGWADWLLGLGPVGVFYFPFLFSFSNTTQIYLNSNEI